MNPPNQLSDTPRTDAAWAKTFQDDEDQCRAGNAATDMRDECATLERELAALTADRDQLRAEVERCNDIINRASVQFFHDGTDGETAAKMLTVLNEAKP
jgi:hypothetical protein